jgi:hypothetical protein
MLLRWGWCEIVAERLLSDLGAAEIPVCIRSIADACGLYLVPSTVTTGGRVALVEDTIYYTRSVSAREQRAHISHEVGHWTLDYYGWPQSERAAWRVGAAVLVPRRDFDATRPPSDLAKRYDVPTKLITRRIRELQRIKRIAELQQHHGERTAERIEIVPALSPIPRT